MTLSQRQLDILDHILVDGQNGLITLLKKNTLSLKLPSTNQLMTKRYQKVTTLTANSVMKLRET